MSEPTSDAALWRSVQSTLENLVIPMLKPGFELDSARPREVLVQVFGE